jgi:hypothetical protein
MFTLETAHIPPQMFNSADKLVADGNFITFLCVVLKQVPVQTVIIFPTCQYSHVECYP